jgi:hypothetical protein
MYEKPKSKRKAMGAMRYLQAIKASSEVRRYLLALMRWYHARGIHHAGGLSAR